MDVHHLQAGGKISAKSVRDLAALAERAKPAHGSGTISTAAGTGPVRDDAGWFLVKITGVSGTGTDAVYSFTERHVVDADGGVDGTAAAGELEDWSSPRQADKDINPARCIVPGTTLATDALALARRNPGNPNEFELWPPGGSDWEPYRITSHAGGGVYAAEKVKLVADADAGTAGDQMGWVAVDPPVTFTTGVRMPSKDYDEDVLKEIPDGQVVLARPSPTLAGYYEITPWGGLKKTTIEHIYRVCVQCVLNGTSQPILRTKMAIRTLSEYGRDRRVLWQPPATGEVNIEDNTDNHIGGT